MVLVRAVFLYSPEQALDTAALHHDAPTGNQTDQPKDREDEDGPQQKFCVVQERQGIVAQERNVGVVDQGGEVESVAEKGGEEIARTAREERKKEELHDVEVEIEREKCAVGHLEPVKLC